MRSIEAGNRKERNISVTTKRGKCRRNRKDLEGEDKDLVATTAMQKRFRPTERRALASQPKNILMVRDLTSTDFVISKINLPYKVSLRHTYASNPYIKNEQGLPKVRGGLIQRDRVALLVIASPCKCNYDIHT
jgi:hypothetical protein